MIVAKFGSNWFSGFREDFWQTLQTDDDGRQVMTIAHMAFWTGELKKKKKKKRIIGLKFLKDLSTRTTIIACKKPLCP